MVEQKIKEFRKTPAYGSQIFICINCSRERIFGHGGRPENKTPLLLCEGSCRKHTIHRYDRTHYGREEHC